MLLSKLVWLYIKRECLREVKFWKNYTACEELKPIALRHLINNTRGMNTLL